MASLDLSVLDAALADGLFKRRLTDRQIIYVSPSIVTAHTILATIDASTHNGIGVQGLINVVYLAPNTVKQFCRWLRLNGLIDGERDSVPGASLVFYSKKSTLTKAK